MVVTNSILNGSPFPSKGYIIINNQDSDRDFSGPIKVGDSIGNNYTSSSDTNIWPKQENITINISSVEFTNYSSLQVYNSFGLICQFIKDVNGNIIIQSFFPSLSIQYSDSSISLPSYMMFEPTSFTLPRIYPNHPLVNSEKKLPFPKSFTLVNNTYLDDIKIVINTINISNSSNESVQHSSTLSNPLVISNFPLLVSGQWITIQLVDDKNSLYWIVLSNQAELTYVTYCPFLDKTAIVVTESIPTGTDVSAISTISFTNTTNFIFDSISLVDSYGSFYSIDQRWDIHSSFTIACPTFSSSVSTNLYSLQLVAKTKQVVDSNPRIPFSWDESTNKAALYIYILNIDGCLRYEYLYGTKLSSVTIESINRSSVILELQKSNRSSPLSYLSVLPSVENGNLFPSDLNIVNNTNSTVSPSTISLNHPIDMTYFVVTTSYGNTLGSLSTLYNGSCQSITLSGTRIGTSIQFYMIDGSGKEYSMIMYNNNNTVLLFYSAYFPTNSIILPFQSCPVLPINTNTTLLKTNLLPNRTYNGKIIPKGDPGTDVNPINQFNNYKLGYEYSSTARDCTNAVGKGDDSKCDGYIDTFGRNANLCALNIYSQSNSKYVCTPSLINGGFYTGYDDVSNDQPAGSYTNESGSTCWSKVRDENHKCVAAPFTKNYSELNCNSCAVKISGSTTNNTASTQLGMCCLGILNGVDFCDTNINPRTSRAMCDSTFNGTDDTNKSICTGQYLESYPCKDFCSTIPDVKKGTMIASATVKRYTDVDPLNMCYINTFNYCASTITSPTCPTINLDGSINGSSSCSVLASGTSSYCTTWFSELSGVTKNNPEVIESFYKKVCSNTPDSTECLCMNRTLDPIYTYYTNQLLNTQTKSYIANQTDTCWYTPCKGQSSIYVPPSLTATNPATCSIFCEQITDLTAGGQITGNNMSKSCTINVSVAPKSSSSDTPVVTKNPNLPGQVNPPVINKPTIQVKTSSSIWIWIGIVLFLLLLAEVLYLIKVKHRLIYISILVVVSIIILVLSQLSLI